MSTQLDAFSKDIRVEIEEGIVRIHNRNSGTLRLLATLIVFSFLVSLIFMGGTWLGNTILALIAGLVAFLGFQEFLRGLYATTILDMDKKQVVRSPAYRFFKPKVNEFQELRGVSLSTKTVGGHTSAYEDGNTDFEKILILETDTGEIPLLTYVSREEEAEKSLTDFAEAIRKRLLSANAS